MRRVVHGKPKEVCVEKETRVVGRKGRQRAAEVVPQVTNWQTDVVENEEPGWKYHWFREDEVRSKLRPTRVRLINFETNEVHVHDIPGWTLCMRDTGPERAAGFNPSESKTPQDQALTHGGGGTVHYCMKIPEEAWDVLMQAQEQRADAYEGKLNVRKHYSRAWNGDGRTTNPNDGEKVTPGQIRQFETFTKES